MVVTVVVVVIEEKWMVDSGYKIMATNWIVVDLRILVETHIVGYGKFHSDLMAANHMAVKGLDFETRD